MEVIQFIYAGFWIRFAAHFIDQLVMGLIGSIIFAPLFFIFGLGLFPFDQLNEFNEFSAVGLQDYGNDTEFAIIVAFIIGVIILSLINTAIQWLYFALFESSSKQATLGKMAFGLKVSDENGNRISFVRASGRYFSKILSGLIFMIGYIMAGFTEKKQALHDMLAGTVVTKGKF